MSRPTPDLARLRTALRGMSRGNLLIVAERAIELVSARRLGNLLGDLVRLDEVAAAGVRDTSLLDEVREFNAAARRREYYEYFRVDSRNFTEKSEGTQSFIAEFDRLLGRCIRAAAKAPRAATREAFDLLFDLLRRIDEDPDAIIFFADEAGAWQLGVDWRAALPPYFRCLADAAAPEDFAREVDRTISDFADYDRRHFVGAARRVANAEQKAALRRLPPPKRHR